MLYKEVEKVTYRVTFILLNNRFLEFVEDPGIAV